MQIKLPNPSSLIPGYLEVSFVKVYDDGEMREQTFADLMDGGDWTVSYIDMYTTNGLCIAEEIEFKDLPLSTQHAIDAEVDWFYHEQREKQRAKVAS